MKLIDIPTGELARIVHDTEAIAGPNSASVRILRREYEKRLAATGRCPICAKRMEHLTTSPERLIV